MAAIDYLTTDQLVALPHFSNAMLQQLGLTIQDISLPCQTCKKMRATIPEYEGNHMYSLDCLVCGDVLDTSVDFDRIFVELDSARI